MDLRASDPDIDTIYNRIRNCEWNLQPDFQRGEVWSAAKKQRLIDTILRGWHVPPIHLIEEPASKAEVVLDGQQRLTAIRDFRNGSIAVNGKLPPQDKEILKLDGKTYEQLPDEVKKFFNRQSIRVLTVTNYQPEEPAELFFRLNQPTNLTTAEQRNAFFGPVRTQIKELVQRLIKSGADAEFLGFSNSRMAYDDVIARVANEIQNKSLKIKVTATSVAELYRSGSPLPSSVIGRLDSAIEALGRLRSVQDENFISMGIRFNKATLHSWLLLLLYVEHDLDEAQAIALYRFVVGFELARSTLKPVGRSLSRITIDDGNLFASEANVRMLIELLGIFNDRAASRVVDVSSVMMRDAILWMFAVTAKVTPPFLEAKLVEAKTLVNHFVKVSEGAGSSEEALLISIQEANWGGRL